MNDLASRIVARRGPPRVIDNMDKAGLSAGTSRRRQAHVLVLIPPDGLATSRSAVQLHHTTIQKHFAEQLDNDPLAELKNSLEQFANTSERYARKDQQLTAPPPARRNLISTHQRLPPPPGPRLLLVTSAQLRVGDGSRPI